MACVFLLFFLVFFFIVFFFLSSVLLLTFNTRLLVLVFSMLPVSFAVLPFLNCLFFSASFPCLGAALGAKYCCVFQGASVDVRNSWVLSRHFEAFESCHPAATPLNTLPQNRHRRRRKAPRPPPPALSLFSTITSLLRHRSPDVRKLRSACLVLFSLFPFA